MQFHMWSVDKLTSKTSKLDAKSLHIVHLTLQ